MIEIEKGWQLSCGPVPEDNDLDIMLKPPFYPIDISGMDIEVSLKCTFLDKKGESTSIDDKPKVRRQTINSSAPYWCGLNGEQIDNATSIQLDIEWEIVALF